MGTRSRLGCLSCRRRKKKCDEVKPICAACLRNNLHCLWPDPKPRGGTLSDLSTLQQRGLDSVLASQSDAWTLITTGAHRENLAAPTIPTSPSLFILPGSVISVSETWRLLDHYLKDTANRLACLQDGANPFLHTLLPAALGDELLMNTILALSGVHMMQRLPKLSPGVQSLTWSSYTRALKQLRVDLSSAFCQHGSTDAAWRALLVVLLFYLLEATRGSDPKAMQGHLEGAHHLMAHVRSTAAPNPTQLSIVSFTTELYVYNAALASLTTNCSPPSTVLPDCWINTSATPCPEVGILYGCAYDIITLVPKVSSLLWEDSAQPSSQASFKTHFIDQYYELRRHIERWKPHSNQYELILCARLYQQSLLLLLDSRFARDDSQNGIDRAFLNLESLLSDLPATSPIATTATWPIFVFGIHAQRQNQRELVRSYLRSLVKVFGMGVMSSALNQLEQIWTTEPGQDMASRFLMNQSSLFLIC